MNIFNLKDLNQEMALLWKMADILNIKYFTSFTPTYSKIEPYMNLLMKKYFKNSGIVIYHNISTQYNCYCFEVNSWQEFESKINKLKAFL